MKQPKPWPFSKYVRKNMEYAAFCPRNHIYIKQFRAISFPQCKRAASAQDAVWLCVGRCKARLWEAEQHIHRSPPRFTFFITVFSLAWTGTLSFRCNIGSNEQCDSLALHLYCTALYFAKHNITLKDAIEIKFIIIIIISIGDVSLAPPTTVSLTFNKIFLHENFKNLGIEHHPGFCRSIQYQCSCLLIRL